MKFRPVLLRIGLVAALLPAALPMLAQDGLKGALSKPSQACPRDFTAPFAQTVAAADFDGDHNPDGAVLSLCERGRPGTSVRIIELHFTGRDNSDLIFESSERALAISAVDVNHDGTVDIVVEQAFTHKRLHVWLNDGRGRFRQARVEDFPSPGSGSTRQAENPRSPLDFPAPGLPTQRSRDLAHRGDQSQPYDSCLAREPALNVEPSLGSFVVRPSSPRAPPLSRLS